MPVVAYCKKCKQEVEQGAICPLCGQKLPQSSLRLSWTYELVPVRDFLCWNSILRVALPALLLLLVLAVGVEWAARGFLAVQTLLTQGLLPLILAVAAVMLLAALAALWIRGREEVQCVLDHQGVHVRVYQSRPGLVKRLFRLLPDAVEADPLGRPVWKLEEKDIPWAMVKRVGLWADRDKILLYNPRFWLCMTVHALPDTYLDAAAFIYDHVKKRPGVMAPPPVPEEIQGPHL